jgi:hypothetical protein
MSSGVNLNSNGTQIQSNWGEFNGNKPTTRQQSGVSSTAMGRFTDAIGDNSNNGS